LENFRSRESLLNFVSSLFAPLMREEIGGVKYDDEAKLKFGSPESRTDFSVAKDPSPRAELLLCLKKKPGEVSDDENGDWADLAESAKEARLVARRLKELVAGSEPQKIWDDEKKIFRAADWRDMAVLLRSPAGKAEVFAKEFERAGVPLVVARGGFYETSEVLDLLSLLQLLDNPLQDAPCIAVLRSPLVGCSFDELAEIRLAAKDVHFWTALNRARSAECGVRNELRRKIEGFLERFSRWRKLARQVSLSQCLEEVLAETHYADWLQSRPRGAQRRANVEQFLNLAQRFDQFQRQGLFRFLNFIKAQREAGAEPEVAPVADENAVRLMSIHQSKGLEFPVVVVADLAKRFNEQDLHGEIILDEKFGLCPRVQPPQTGGRYPSLPHWLAQRRERRELRGEELRLLYVALTRARDTLVLIATVSETKWESLWTGSEAITPQAIVAAKSYSDWLGMWFAQNQAQNPESKVPSATGGQLPHLRWRLADESELAAEPAVEQAAKELPPLDEKTGRRLQAILAWKYPFAEATRRAAKSSVTELRRRATEPDEEAERIFPAPRFAPVGRRQARAGLSAADTGRAHHKFLQFVALEKTADLEALKSEASRLKQENILTAEECAALILEDIAAFWESAAGRKIRTQAATVRREMAFTARFSPVELEDVAGVKSAAGLEDELVVVQGVADLVVVLPEEIWLVDFKTDDIRQSGLPDKIKAYAPQLNLYARALEKIYARPVTARWLHFLAARRTESI